MDNLELWWSGLDALARGYWLTAVFSTLLFVAFFVMSMMGGDADADSDLDSDSDCDGDADEGGISNLLSLKTILAFLMGGSWAGVSILSGGGSAIFAVLASIVSGAVVMAAMAFLIRSLMKLQHNSILTMDKTVGLDGEVYLPINPGMKPGGQVELLVNGSYKVFEAVTQEAIPIKPKERIVVLEVLEGNVLLVGRMDIPIDGSQAQMLDNQ